MANADTPVGASPVNADGSPYTGPLRSYDVDSSNGTAIFRGDFVAQEADGNITPATAGAGNDILGVAVGIDIDPAEEKTEYPGYLPASTSGSVLVAPAASAYFVIQEDSVGGTLAAADKGARANFVAGSGSTLTGLSAHEIDSSGAGTGATLQLQLMYPVDRPDNEIGANADWIVRVNLPQHRVATAGI